MIVFEIVVAKPQLFRFRARPGGPDHFFTNRLYIYFQYANGATTSQPMTFRYQQGGFYPTDADHQDQQMAAITDLNNPIILQLGHYLDVLLHHSLIDYFHLEHLLCLLMECLLEAYQKSLSSTESGLTPRQLQKVKKYVAQSLDQPFNLQTLAAHLSLSKYHFCRMFKKCTGESPSAYVTRQKMQHAKALISQTNLPIIQVTYEVGYQNPGHFATTFRKAFGQTPSQWRKHVKAT